MLQAEPERLWLLWTEPERLGCFGQSPKDLFGTAAAAAEGGRDTRVLGDPMDLIRCQSYLAKHGGTQHKQVQLGTVDRLLDKMEKEM